MVNYYCRYCGAEAEVYKRQGCHDAHTGELDGYFVYLRCTAHRFLHRFMEYEMDNPHE